METWLLSVVLMSEAEEEHRKEVTVGRGKRGSDAEQWEIEKSGECIAREVENELLGVVPMDIKHKLCGPRTAGGHLRVHWPGIKLKASKDFGPAGRWLLLWWSVELNKSGELKRVENVPWKLHEKDAGIAALR